MTLPTGQIAYSDVNVETGAPWNRSIGMNWIYDNTRPGQQAHNLNNVRGKAWFQRNVDGNCNNGNCNCAGNCGNIQCTNCYPYQCINCANCDGRAYIQNNCNCACTYNCNAGAVSYNCNCACDCACACYCDCGGNG